MEEAAMTLMLIEDTMSEEETLAQQSAPSVKCSWCGEIIRLDANKLSLAMCRTCHKGMMIEFLRAQQTYSANRHASDR
jgi:Zn finger protein HypA/HybF involved in hydrogenase expression